MNKNLLLVGAVAVAGFLTLTAFGGKTLEQQQAEVKAAVDAKVASRRLEKQAECDSRVMAAAQTKYDEVLAARTAEASMTTKGGMVKKGTKTKGPRVDPLPQPTKPTSTSPSKDKWNQTGAPQPSKDKWTPTTQDGKPVEKSPSKSKWDKPNGSGN